MTTLDDMGPAKLHDLERQRIRNAADALLFADASDPGAIEALADVESLMRQLADVDRWTAERARALADDVASCGPVWGADLPVAEPARAA